MIGVERVPLVVALLFTEPEEALDVAGAVRPVLPLAGGPPLELRALGRSGQSLSSAEQCFDVDAVVDRGFRCGHVPLLQWPLTRSRSHMRSHRWSGPLRVRGRNVLLRCVQ